MAPRTIQFLFEVLVEQAAIVEARKGVGGRIHLKFLELTVFHHDGNAKLIRRRQHVHQCGLQRNRAADSERKLAPALERLIPELQALSFIQFKLRDGTEIPLQELAASRDIERFESVRKEFEE